MITTMSMPQALELWSELEQCYYNDNGYGGDTCEIYIYRVCPRSPSIEMLGDAAFESEIYGDDTRRYYYAACQSIFQICYYYQYHRNCKVELLEGELIDLKTKLFDHRIHLKVVRND